MAKPEKSKEKNKKRHENSVDDWLNKGWLAATVKAESEFSDEIPVDHLNEVFVLFGQFFDEDGSQLKGRDRPHAHVEETTLGVVVEFSKPLIEDVTLLYKIEYAVEEPEPEAA